MDEFRGRACDGEVGVETAKAVLRHLLPGTGVSRLSLSEAGVVLNRLSSTQWTPAEAARYVEKVLAEEDE